MADYLIHFNKNHDHKNGQFTFGDGDGDGVRNDHKKKNDTTSSGYKKAKSSMFKVKPENFRDSEGNYDFDAQTKAGVKRIIVGMGAIAVGAIAEGASDNLIVKGAGFVTAMVGFGAVGSGIGQVVGSRMNKKYADPKEYPQVKKA